MSTSTAPGDDGDRTVVARSGAQGTLRVGTTLINGNYVIDAFLARGGMGEVYRATHIHEGDSYAIKVILPEIAQDDTVMALFRREARDLKRVNHDSIVRYRDFLSDGSGAYFLIMEFVDGEPLGGVLQQRRFEAEEVLGLLRRVGPGLAAVHELGLIHRDISPDNMLLPGGEIGRAKLIDFGIAKSTEPGDQTIIGGSFAGKFSFVSPEQAAPISFGRVLDARSDIYSLGLVLASAALGYGKRLEMGHSFEEIIHARQAVPDLSEMPAALRPLLTGMLQPRPQDRPASMHAVLERVGGQPIQSAAASVAAKKKPAARRSRLALWLGGAALAVGAVIAAVLFATRALAPSVDALKNDLAVATGGYQCAALTYSADGSGAVTVSGYVKSDQDLVRLRDAVGALPGVSKLNFNVQQRIWPYCGVMALLKPILASGERAPTIRLASAAAPAYAGRPLVLDVQAPAFDSYVYVDYFQANGNVVHLLPNGRDWINLRPARNRFVLGRQPMLDCWKFAGTPGEQMVTLVASRRPLSASNAPAIESAQDYLARLAQLLNDTDSKSATTLFYNLGPGSGPIADDNACAAQ